MRSCLSIKTNSDKALRRQMFKQYLLLTDFYLIYAIHCGKLHQDKYEVDEVINEFFGYEDFDLGPEKDSSDVDCMWYATTKNTLV